MTSKLVDLKDGNIGKLYRNNHLRSFRSPGYNWNFNIATGRMNRWGKNENDDPKFSPFGPEILDLEVSTICGRNCSYCYKSNTEKGKNMPFETFKSIFDKMPHNLTQIAFGVGDLNANPDLQTMFKYCRENVVNEVVPNLTINGLGLTQDMADFMSEYCGSIAVSWSSTDPEPCYNAVEKLLKAEVTQVNIHVVMSEKDSFNIPPLITKISVDSKLKGISALVFLLLKPRGRAEGMHPIKYSSFKEIVKQGLENKNISIGFDSCSAPYFLSYIKEEFPEEEAKKYEEYVEACESSLFSSYINVDGKYCHCSFAESIEGWIGVDVLSAEDFIKDVWFHPETVKFREGLLIQNHKISKECRLCPIFKNLYNGKEF